MTIIEIEERLPNGFHDAKINRMYIEYVDRTLIIEINIIISEPNDVEIISKNVILNISGLVFCSIGLPDYSYNIPGFTEAWISASMSEKPKELTINKPFYHPDGAFEHYFYINNWNTYIVIVALDANLEEW